jgi:hypothetical protein
VPGVTVLTSLLYLVVMIIVAKHSNTFLLSAHLFTLNLSTYEGRNLIKLLLPPRDFDNFCIHLDDNC